MPETSNLLGEKHTLPTFINQNPFTANSLMQKKKLFLKLVFQGLFLVQSK